MRGLIDGRPVRLHGITGAFRIIVALGITLALGVAGCAGGHGAPSVSALYDRTAQYHGADRNPVILIPGVLGSRLVDRPSGRIVWGAFSGDYANPGEPDGARLIALPMAENRPLTELRDSVISDGALDNIHIKVLGFPFQIGAYINILSALGIGGYRDETLATRVDYGDDHFTCFQFDYDWRRDNVENARRLEVFIKDKRAYVRRELKKRYSKENADVKFDIVAHSMGGLLTRYFLRYGGQDLPTDGSTPEVTWAGARYVERVVLVGPPNAGSMEAQVQLVEGKKFGMIFPRYDAALLGTMPSVYQVLPRGRHGYMVDAADTARTITDNMNPQLWEDMGWGLASPKQAQVLARLLPDITDPQTRRRIALDHQRKCLNRARQFHAALDTPATPPNSLDLILIAGDATHTPARVAADRTTGKIDVFATAAGDGKVLRSSSLMDERVGQTWTPTLRSPILWRQVIFLSTKHLDLTGDPAFIDNMLYILLEEPRPSQRPGD